MRCAAEIIERKAFLVYQKYYVYQSLSRGLLPGELGGGVRPDSQNPYPIYDQNGQILHSIYDQNGWKATLSGLHIPIQPI